MSASPDDIQNVIEGTFSLLALFGWVPAALAAPVVLIGRGIAGIFHKDKESI